MLELIIGRNEEQRKEYLYAQIEKVLSEKNKKIILLVPEQASFAREKDILLRFGPKVASGMQICGFSRLATMLLQEAGVPVKPQVDEAGRNVLMSLAVENAAGASGLYAAHAGRGKLLRDLLAARDELKQACLLPQELTAAATRLQAPSLRQKAAELAHIFDVYDALVTRRFSDKSDNINLLTQTMKTVPLLANTVVFADGFRGFTEQQFQCILQMLRSCDALHICLCSEKNAAAQEDSAFAHSERARRYLHHLAQKADVQIKETYLADAVQADNALVYLREALYDVSAEPFEADASAVTIVSASDKYAECDYCAAEAARLLREEGYRARDIAVIERQPGNYSKALAAAFRRCGVPCFEDLRRPLSSFALIRLVLSVCDAAGTRLTAERLMNALKTGLAGVDVKDCALLESYIHLWQLDGNRLSYDFTGHPDGFGKPMEERDREKLALINNIRKTAVEPILRLRKDLDGADGKQACEAVYRYLVRINAADSLRAYAQRLDKNGHTHDAIECGRIWDVLMELLDALQEAIGPQTVSAARFAELLHIMVDSADIGDIPDGIDEVAVGDAQRIRPDGAKVVFVVGANEGLFPAAASDYGIFTRNEKKQLREASFALGDAAEELCAEERLLVYSVLTAAREKLYVTFSTSDLHAGALYPSEIVSMLKAVYPQCCVVNANEMSVLDKTVSVQTAFENAALLARQNTALSASLRAYVDGKEMYADRLAAVDRAAAGRQFAFSDTKNAQLLFNKDLYLSPSRVESFFKCSFSYFCRYGLRLETPAAAKLDASHNGLLIHYVLEKLLEQYPDGTLVSLSAEVLQQTVHQLCEEYTETYMGGKDAMPLRLQWQLVRAEKTALEIAQRLCTEFGNGLFVTKDVELAVQGDGVVQPFTVQLPDGGSVTVAGVVDRVDVMEEDGRSYLRVIDYKTGGKTFRLSDLEAGLNMQMLLYLMCLWDNGKERYGNVIPAGILYVPAKTGKLELPRNASAEEIAKQKTKNGKMNGLVLSEKNVILGMDSTGAGVFINASIDKNGNIKGSVASLEDFMYIHKRIETLLGEMHGNLRQGTISAVPVEGSGYKDICKYCNYANVCCRESTAPVRRIDKAGEVE